MGPPGPEGPPGTGDVPGEVSIGAIVSDTEPVPDPENPWPLGQLWIQPVLVRVTPQTVRLSPPSTEVDVAAGSAYAAVPTWPSFQYVTPAAGQLIVTFYGWVRHMSAGTGYSFQARSSVVGAGGQPIYQETVYIAGDNTLTYSFAQRAAYRYGADVPVTIIPQTSVGGAPPAVPKVRYCHLLAEFVPDVTMGLVQG